VSRKADETNQAFFLRFQDSLHRTVWTEGLLNILFRPQSVELVKVKVVGLKPLQRLAEGFCCPLLIALFGLAGKENLVPKPFQCRTEPFLSVAVSWGDIKVGDAIVVCPTDHRISIFLGHVHDDDTAHSDCGNLNARLAQNSSRHTSVTCAHCRCTSQSDTDGLQKLAPFHSHFGHLVPQGCGKVYSMQGQQASEGAKFMARRRKASAQQETQGLPLWAQIAVVLWMVGTLVWFFSDHKIQQWLAAMISDLIQWR
jgi:hypothetical protein